jgi:hypothetical protein
VEPGAAARLAVSDTTPLIGLVETGALTVLTRLAGWESHPAGPRALARRDTHAPAG